MANNSKSETMKALMRNKNNAKLFRDAMSSPLGSTSRMKAQKMFSIMNKLQGNHDDGQGGPGMMMERYEQPQQMEVNDTPSAMVVFHKLPPLDINYNGVARSTPQKGDVNDGAGGPGVMDGEGGIGDWLGGALNTFENAAGAVGGAVAHTVGDIVSPAATAIYDLSQAANGAQNQTHLQQILGAPAAAANAVGSAIGNTAASVGNTMVQGVQKIGSGIGAGIKWLNAPVTPTNPPIKDANAVGNYQTQNANSGGVLSPQSAAIYANNPLGSTNAPNFQNLDGSNVYVPPTPVSQFKNLGAFNTPAATSPVPPPATSTVSQNGSQNGSTLGAYSGPNQSSQDNSGSNSSIAGSAAIKYSQALGVDPASALSGVIATKGMAAIVSAIKANEGGSPSGVVNNPGNVKFTGAPGQIDSGVQATDGGTFASYATPQSGDQAIADIVTAAASGQSSSYGANPTLLSFANTYTNTGPGASSGSGVAGASSSPSDSTPGTGYSGVQAAVQNAIGGDMFALQTEIDPNNPVTGGLSLAQAEAANKTNIWKDFNIDGLAAQKADLENVQAILPKDMTDFIRDQDQYLNQTDQMINDYIAKTANDNNPQDRVAIANHLNYLYTLRGAQNTRYINYMNSSIAMNDTKLKTVTDSYDAAVKNATDALTSQNAITKDMYDTYTKALSGMYDAVEKAPIAAQQYRLVEQQILVAHANAISDAAKANSQADYLTVYPKMKDQIYDSNGFAMPIDLVNTLAAFANSNPDIDSGVLLRIYNNTVNNTLKAPSGSKDGNSQPIDKTKAAQAAFTNYAKLAGEGVNEQDQNLIINAIGYGDQVAATYGNILGGQWSGDPSTVSKIKNLITSLGSKSLFGGSSTPSRSTFVSNAQRQGLDTGMASALYDQFADYMGTPGAKPEDFVNASLNNTESQTGRVPWSDSDLMSHVGQMYANSLFAKSLAQSGLQRNADGSVTITGAGSTTTI